MALKLTEEESVFVEQLFRVREQMEKLVIEENTHTDRLLTIMRGHGAKEAIGRDGFTVSRVKFDSSEAIIIRYNGRLPHELREVLRVNGPEQGE